MNHTWNETQKLHYNNVAMASKILILVNQNIIVKAGAVQNKCHEKWYALSEPTMSICLIKLYISFSAFFPLFILTSFRHWMLQRLLLGINKLFVDNEYVYVMYITSLEAKTQNGWRTDSRRKGSIRIADGWQKDVKKIVEVWKARFVEV